MMYLINLLVLAAPCWGFLFVADTPAPNSPMPQPSQNFSHHGQLDDNYHLYWDFNTTHIVFEVNVRTNGYIGFGISPNGGMKGSDVVIGWVNNGQAYFTDRHSNGNSFPDVDSSQDWFLLQATEDGEYTVLKMVRKLDTCDPNDRPILDGTTRVIYSYSLSDPPSESSIAYHGPSQRGTKSLLLLDPPTDESSTKNLPTNVITVDFLNNNYSVPGKDTTYHSLIIKLKDLGQKHHMIRFEPVIQEGHEKLVHHILLYACVLNLDGSYVGTSYESDVFIPVELNGLCEIVFSAWAIGGSAFDYPEHVGHSLGTSQDPTYFRLETHYDNPSLRSDYVDNSGIRLYLTTDLRQHDAEIMEIGALPDTSQIIPPYDTNFLVNGYCSATCLAGAFGDQEIHVFATILHAHLLGRKLRTRHFRNGVELPPLSEDLNYDFNYQETRSVMPERILKSGDSLIYECTYDSSGRTNITYGGLSTRHEMCVSFLWYYPRTTLTTCLSAVVYKLPDEYTKKNVTVADYVKQQDWTKSDVRDAFKKIITDSSISSFCHGDTPDLKWHMRAEPKPNITSEYHAPSLCPTA